MNILLVTNNSLYFENQFGGAESSIQLLAKELAQLGHNIYYATKIHSKSVIFKLVKQKTDKVSLYATGFLERFRHFTLIEQIQDILFSVQISYLIKTKKIDIVYCFYELNILKILLKLKKKNQRTKIVMRMAGMHWFEKCQKNPSLIKIYEQVFNQFDAINFIHGSLEKMVIENASLLNMNIRFQKTFIGDIGTSASIGRSMAYDYHPNETFNLIMATRFSDYQKRQDILVKAISLLPDDLPVKLILIGSGKRKNTIETMIRELGLSSRIVIEPFSDQIQLWQKMQQADLLCHACDYEGLSKIIIESMSMGLPVLVSNVEPLNNYILDGENGFLVDNTPEKWAGRIQELMQHAELLKKVSDQSIEYILQNYNPQKNVLIYENAFEDLLSNQLT